MKFKIQYNETWGDTPYRVQKLLENLSLDSVVVDEKIDWNWFTLKHFETQKEAEEFIDAAIEKNKRDITTTIKVVSG